MSKEDIKFQDDYKFGFKDEDVSVLKTDSVALTVSNDKVNASSLKLGEGVLYPAEDLL